MHRVELALAADDREASETLFVSHAATAGRFDRQLTVIEPESADLSASIDWKAPGSGADTNRIARLYFVVRDLRGGVDWTARTLCVVP